MLSGQSNWDYIVVGAGSAGCVVADRLSESGSHRVLLLEAGPPDTPLMKPAAVSWYVDLSRFEWGYWSRPDPSRGMRKEQWRRGRVLGGTSSINGMEYVRGARADFDRWAAMGNVGWSADDVMPLFRALEHCEPGYRTPPDYTIRGDSGPLPIRQARNCHPLTNAFVKAAQAAGYPYNSDYNGADQSGVSYMQFNQRRGLRCSSADAFLKPALRRKNLEVQTGATVHKLLVRDRYITGVRYERNGEVHVAHAGNVVLCGGAINTPKILMLSGIGEAEALRDLGIGVVVDRPGVGKNLMEHPLMRPSYRTKKPSYNPTHGIWQKAGFMAKFLFTRQGPIATPMEATAFLKTNPREAAPDVQMHFSPVGIVYTDDPKIHKGLTVLPYPSFSVFVNKNYPVSRGQIRLTSADPKAAPLIEPNLLGDERDVATMVGALQLVRRIVSTAPLADMIIDEAEPGVERTTYEELAEYVRARTGLAYHPSGTCRMGTDDDAVVTPDLKVRGLENLWIADASVMPDLISGNTNAVCMMIGEKLARQLVGIRGSQQNRENANEVPLHI
ncbi:GMC family oxidoreductase [Paraburkholderia sp. NPDC080076]|uniref:GMC family oxidoreductase n=1 Tax=Paraburkholderia sp. NPDC080076 TaxID=3390605 RepID=UPI003D056EB3